MSFLFSENQLQTFVDFDEWIADNHHSIYSDSEETIDLYWENRCRMRKQILKGLVAEIFLELSDQDLKDFQAKIDLELDRRSKERKERLRFLALNAKTVEDFLNSKYKNFG
jgi:hypothetical protein